MAWTLTIRGKTNSAKGWLQPEWEINRLIMMENNGGTVDDDNEAPTITGGPSTIRTVKNPSAVPPPAPGSVAVQ